MPVTAFLLALLLLINPYIPQLGGHARIVDLVSVALLPFAALQAAKGTHSSRKAVIGVIALALLEIPWLVIDWTDLGLFAPVYSTRWFELTVYGFSISTATIVASGRAGFSLGMLSGAAVNSVILWLQSRGHDAMLVSMGMAHAAFETVAMKGHERYAGLHGHPNGAAAVISLAVPAAIGCINAFGRKWLFTAVAAVVCIAGAYFTFTRSAFLVAGAVYLIWLLTSAKRNALPVLAILSVASIALGGFLQGSGLAERWEANDLDSNGSTRIQTTLDSMAEVLNSPMGYGYRHDSVALATHNAFTGLALSGGLLLALFVLAATLSQAFGSVRLSRVENWTALQLLGLCMFEEHFNNPTMIGLAIWLICRAFQNLHSGASPRLVKQTSSRGLSTYRWNFPAGVTRV